MDSIKTGKLIILGLMTLGLLNQIFIETHNFSAIRLLVTIALLLSLYNGYDLAKRLVIGLSGIAAVLSVMWFINTLDYRWLLYAGSNFIIAWTLGKSSAVNAYLNQQKEL